MNTRCPCCGAQNSLDALMAHEEAREAVWAVAQIGGELGRLAVQYIALFRPEKTVLTFGRMSKLLNEILSDMQCQSITRDGIAYPAPPEAWAFAIRQMLDRRASGSLKLPLKSHGYLYEIITGWQGAGVKTLPAQPLKQPSKTLAAAAKLEGLKK